ncbi:hypothetical protein [Agromyces sp. M3QZ16-3]|uniref:hypothetical protein n=1 Tax=Agromyces sp. M3QZ16-3 TaxID=3447585 RepID=UPI003F68E336
MILGDIGTWAGALAAATTAATAIVLAAQLRNRERRQALVDLHVSLTTGETALARNVIGTLLLNKSFRGRPAKLEAIDAYFRLIWSVQRARNVFRAHGFHWESLDPPEGAKRNSRQRETERALSWNLIEIAENIVEFHHVYVQKWGVEDKDAWDEMDAYLKRDSKLRRSTNA